MLMYHGSSNENLVVTENASGAAYNFGALFFTANYRLASEYGDFVYQCEVDMNSVFMSASDSDETVEALYAIMAERGISEEHFDLCWSAIVCEDMDFQEQEDWVELIGLDDDAASWEAQVMRIALARRLGFHGCGMNDECGSIAVLTEYIVLEVAVDPDEEDEE